ALSQRRLPGHRPGPPAPAPGHSALVRHGAALLGRVDGLPLGLPLALRDAAPGVQSAGAPGGMGVRDRRPDAVLVRDLPGAPRAPPSEKAWTATACSPRPRPRPPAGRCGSPEAGAEAPRRATRAPPQGD